MFNLKEIEQASSQKSSVGYGEVFFLGLYKNIYIERNEKNRGFLGNLFIFVSFAGCSFSSSDEDISGGGSKKSFHKVCGSSSLKMDSSRNAFPSYQAENLFYYFYVKNSDGSTEKESFGAENSFSFSLENGEWIIFCDVYYGSALDDENFKADGNIIFSGSNSISLDDTSGDETDFKINTKIYSSENAKGKAN